MEGEASGCRWSLLEELLFIFTSQSLLRALRYESDEPMSQQNGEGYKMQPSQCLGQTFIVTNQPAEACHPGKATFNDQAMRQQHKPELGGRQFNHFQTDAMRLSISRGLFTRIALICKSNLDRFAGRCLDQFGQGRDLCSILFIGRGHQDCQQLPQRINGHMHLETLAPLVSIVASASTAFWTRLQRSAVQNGSPRLWHSVVDLSYQHAQIANHILEYACFQPALRLLVDRIPHGGKSLGIIRHCAPVRTR